jgi:uncharacterized protein involved in exopolysaccharide biosynthesis
MNEEFDINEIQSTFDIKGFLFKLLSHWPLFLISLAIAFGIAYYINVRKLPIYKMENMISIKDDQNPFFTTNTSLTFNWGGTTDKVNTAIITLKSRSHNEEVVKRLQYYLTYRMDGKYQKVDAYRRTPFTIEVDTTQPQILWKEFTVQFKDSIRFDLSLNFEEGRMHTLQIFDERRTIQREFFETRRFTKEYRLGDNIDLPFFSGTIKPHKYLVPAAGDVYYFNFRNFDGVVQQYLNISAQTESKGSSVIRLRLNGTNKAKLVDYLNTSVKVLDKNMLDRKNLFATKTIEFIDSTLTDKEADLAAVEDELNKFKKDNEIFDLSTEGRDINNKLNQLDVRQESIKRELNYYTTLEDYLVNRKDYRDVPAPSVAGISEGSVVQGVGLIVQKARERNTLEYSYKEGAPVFKDIDRQIDAIKTVLLENIASSKGLKNQELDLVNQQIAQNEADIRKLPREQQDLLKIERSYQLSQATYNLFLNKRSEAKLVQAANVSDVLIIDSAKDTGGGA